MKIDEGVLYGYTNSQEVRFDILLTKSQMFKCLLDPAYYDPLNASVYAANLTRSLDESNTTQSPMSICEVA